MFVVNEIRNPEESTNLGWAVLALLQCASEIRPGATQETSKGLTPMLFLCSLNCLFIMISFALNIEKKHFMYRKQKRFMSIAQVDIPV